MPFKNVQVAAYAPLTGVETGNTERDKNDSLSGNAEKNEHLFSRPASTEHDCKVRSGQDTRGRNENVSPRPRTAEQNENVSSRPGTAERNENVSSKPGTAERNEKVSLRPGTAEKNENVFSKQKTAENHEQFPDSMEKKANEAVQVTTTGMDSMNKTGNVVDNSGFVTDIQELEDVPPGTVIVFSDTAGHAPSGSTCPPSKLEPSELPRLAWTPPLKPFYGTSEPAVTKIEIAFTPPPVLGNSHKPLPAWTTPTPELFPTYTEELPINHTGQLFNPLLDNDNGYF